MIEKKVYHPGALLAKFLTEKGISIKELSKRTDIPITTLTSICAEKSPITESTAFKLKLSYIFNYSSDFWLNLQQEYDNNIVKKLCSKGLN